MIRFSLEKPVILAVAIIIVCLLGLAALFRVPIQLIPDLDPRVVTVQTWWPGANPQDIERAEANPNVSGYVEKPVRKTDIAALFGGLGGQPA